MVRTYVKKKVGNNDGKGPICTLDFMETKGNNKFLWPAKPDVIPVPLNDILLVCQAPVPVDNRHLGITKKEYAQVCKLFVSYSQNNL